ncbi:ABC-three component system middle component 2 [Hyalangium minutum]|uniref:ABC-three component system middle component 2 n=1 Tax=Hyalangium minutum TaxID=394096 RepID=UPI0005C5DAC7|nr:ABC-three component system middle component 2 [Hyalangium minutum]
MSSARVLNGPVEVGLRALVLLLESSPHSLDLQQLVTLDYFLVHSGDIDGGPESLHPPSPLRSGEVAVRRALIEEGLSLYKFRGLVQQSLVETGFAYSAESGAGAFLDALRSGYVERLRVRAEWVIASFALLEAGELHQTLEASLSRWRTEFVDLLPESEVV